MPDSQPYQKKKVALVWLWNFLLPGLGLGTLYACGTGALGILFWFWLLELFFSRLDVVLFVSVAMSVWGTIEVARQNQAIEFEEELNVAATLPGTLAAVDNLIDSVSKGLVSTIEDGDTVYALDTLEKKAREAELRLKSIEEKLNTQTKTQADEITGKSLAALPQTLGATQTPGGEYSFDKPAEPVIAGEARNELMSFAPLFETVEDDRGHSLPLGKEPEPLPVERSSLRPGVDLTLSFSPPVEELTPDEEAIRAWLDTGSGAGGADAVDESVHVEDACQVVDSVSANVDGVSTGVDSAKANVDIIDTQIEDLSAEAESTGRPLESASAFDSDASVQAAVALESSEPTDVPSESSTCPAGSLTLPDMPEPIEAELAPQRESSFLLESSTDLENGIPAVDFETSATDVLDIPASLSVAGLDAPFESTGVSASAGATSALAANSSTDFFSFLSEKDRKVTEFVDKLANTIGSAGSPQPTIDSAFEFSIPNFESSFSFDFSNALSDVVAEKDAASTASKGSKHCQRCGSDRQSEFSFCLKCGISFST